MEDKLRKMLLDINAEFYSKTSSYFSSSREYHWDGWKNLLDKGYIDSKKTISVFDVGCGNGRFATFLKENNCQFKYFGIDGSKELIQIAKKKNILNNIGFEKLELKQINKVNGNFDLITLFAVLHHLPDENKRIELIQELAKKLVTGGYLIFSTWEFLEDESQKKKILNWEDIGINHNDLEKGDYLLSWQRGVIAYRYCHSFNKQEITNLIEKSELKLVNEYAADGKNGKLNKYYVLMKL